MLTEPPLLTASVPLTVETDAPKSTLFWSETLTLTSKTSVPPPALVTVFDPVKVKLLPAAPVTVRAAPLTKTLPPLFCRMSVWPFKSIPPELTNWSTLPDEALTSTPVAGLLLRVRFPPVLSTMR
jgi:hypothetical protein